MRAQASIAAAIASGGFFVVTWCGPPMSHHSEFGPWVGEIASPCAETKDDALEICRQWAERAGKGRRLVRREGETVRLSRIYAGTIGGFFHDQVENVTDEFELI